MIFTTRDLFRFQGIATTHWKPEGRFGSSGLPLPAPGVMAWMINLCGISVTVVESQTKSGTSFPLTADHQSCTGRWSTGSFSGTPRRVKRFAHRFNV
ncbi:hypothetical protein F4W66_15390 [Escherichia coli]|nr:hypothetical protein F4W66_15390 [Escherichia coli]